MSYFSFDWILGKKDLKKIMAVQLSGPVLWVDLIKEISNNRNRLLLEVGPGAVIFRTVKWIDRNIEMMTTGSTEGLNAVIEKLKKVNT
jgi:malonyl CoA-acyl carrier protein transacylase